MRELKDSRGTDASARRRGRRHHRGPQRGHRGPADGDGHRQDLSSQKGETDKTLGHIASKARAAGIVVVEADRRKLDAMSRTHAHQGVIALAAVREYVTCGEHSAVRRRPGTRRR